MVYIPRLSKNIVRMIECPLCGAQPGSKCKGNRSLREGNHKERVEIAKKLPEIELHLTRQLPEGFVRGFHCPECGAQPGFHCIGRRQERLRNHASRIVFAQNHERARDFPENLKIAERFILTVSCEECGAPPGLPCDGKRKPRVTPHHTRLFSAAKQPNADQYRTEIDLASSEIILVACPYCGSVPGERCRNSEGEIWKIFSHVERALAWEIRK